MDKVKVVLFKLPFPFEVIHDELNIWGHPVRLDRADVVSNHTGAGEFPILWDQFYWYRRIDQGGFNILGNVQGPNTCSGPEIKNVLW